MNDSPIHCRLSGLPPTPERLRQRGEPTLRATHCHRDSVLGTTGLPQTADAQCPKRSLDPGPHVPPVKTAKPAAKRRNGDRLDAPRADFIDKSGEAGVDVLHPALVPPVLLGRKIDDVFLVCQLPGFDHQHAARPQFSTLAGGLIGRKIPGPHPLKLEREAASHDADAVDRVDKDFRIRLQQVAASSVFDIAPPLNRFLTSPRLEIISWAARAECCTIERAECCTIDRGAAVV